jgi:hypothetical protein
MESIKSHDTKSPDYAALVKLLPTLKHAVDALAEVILTPSEAEKIQPLGFTAHPGRWRVPPIPPELVAGNGFLEHLASRWDPFWALRHDGQDAMHATDPAHQPGIVVDTATSPTPPTETAAEIDGFHPEPDRCYTEPASAATDRPEPIAPSKVELQILHLLERHGGQMPRRLLQQKCWRRTAEEFNQALAALIAQQVVDEEGPVIRVTRAVTQDRSEGGASFYTHQLLTLDPVRHPSRSYSL